MGSFEGTGDLDHHLGVDLVGLAEVCAIVSKTGYPASLQMRTGYDTDVKCP